MVEPPMTLMLEIVEGPGAGARFDVARPLVIGRDDSADLVIADSQASRRHARIEPSAHGAIIEDLQSTNGTFINDNELHGRAEIGPDDQLVIGVTVMQVRTPQDVERRPSAVRPVPAFAVPESRPAFTTPVSGAGAAPPTDSGVPELERLRDSRVKAKASLAPLAIFVLAALAVVIYLGAT
jgi:pSer/pThr/pTyr-binding forkhead associated (FHA) protein